MNEELYQQVANLQKDIEQKRDEIIKLRKQMELEPINDYQLKDWNGNEVALSSLFDDKNELLIIHNMGKGCRYCTLWADGFNGFALPMADRMPFVVVSPDEPKNTKRICRKQGLEF